MRYFWIFLILMFGKAQATHIVGGDISIRQILKDENLYEIIVTLLFDDIQGNPRAEATTLPVGIFRRSDHKNLGNYLVTRYSNRDFLAYTDLQCVNGNPRTRIIKYRASISFDPSLYQDPIYFAVENCCRNGVITNIKNPGFAGHVFYAEFPGVWSGGVLFNNSSPVFSQLKGDYACVGRDLLLDFSARDADADSLVYDLCTPLNGASSQTEVIPDPVNSGPYKLINWLVGYDSVSLRNGGFIHIDERTGRVLVHAKEKGLNVFTVRCSEYRQGVKIGEVRRDYQIFVDDCPPITQPNIVFRNQAQIYKDSSSVFIVRENERFEVIARDSSQVIDLIYKPLNFNLSSIEAQNTSGFLENFQDSLLSGFLWTDCRTLDSNFMYKMQVIVVNRSCPQPYRDTVLLKFNVRVPSNKPPENLLTPSKIGYDVLVNDKPITFAIKSSHTDSAVIDIDQFTRSISVNEDFNVTAYGFKAQIKSSRNQLNTQITFSPSCAILAKDSVFRVRYISNELYCNQLLKDTTHLIFHLQDIPYSADTLSLTNIFTPDGDQFNDVFILRGMPPDRCNDAFEKAYIYNRWGVQILESMDRQINWDGSNAENGVYIYEVNYQKSHYKGYVELRR